MCSSFCSLMLVKLINQCIVNLLFSRISFIGFISIHVWLKCLLSSLCWISQCSYPMTDEASVNRQRIVDLQGFGNWVDDPVFRALRQALSCRRHETLSLLELFGGLSSGSIAALCLGFTNTVQSGYVDIETGLLRFIRRLHGLEFIERNWIVLRSLCLFEIGQI